ncbi:MAG: translocation/assembly module TamB domain-containing protein [Deltaproteobacteria bacterium]|nr:translocation/assembly module TamB domain-containing protein [Deltaproteobacteria bacterium]
MTKEQPKKILFKTLKWIGITFMTVLIVLSLLFAGIQTDTAKRGLARFVSDTLRQEGLGIQIQGLDGFIPFCFSIENLSLTDPEGVLFHARDLRLAWHPLSLIHGHLRIAEVKAPFIAVQRLPKTPPQHENERQPIIPALPLWPLSLPDIRIEELKVEQIHLAGPVLGQAADLSLHGTMSADHHHFMSQFILDYRDKSKSLIDLLLVLEGEKPVMDLRLTIDESEPGLISFLLGLKEKGPLHAELIGKGPLTNWPAALSVAIERLGTLKADVLLTARENLLLKINGRAGFTESMLSSFPVSLPISHTNPFQLEFDMGSIQKPFMKSLTLSTSWARARIETTLHEGQPLTGRYALQVPDLSVFEDLLGGETGGGMDLSGEFSGPLHQPCTNLKLDISQPRFQKYRARALTLVLDLEGSGKGSWTFPSLKAHLKGHIEGLLQGEGDQIIPADPFEWDLQAAIRKIKQDTWRFDHLRFESGDSWFTFTGQLDSSLALKGTMEADIPDMANVLPFRLRNFQGRLHLQAEGQGQLSPPIVSAKVQGYTEGIKGLHPELDALLKSKTAYSGRIILKPQSSIEIQGLTLEASWASLSGRASINLNTKEISGTACLNLPELEVLKDLTGVDMNGPLGLEGTFSGKIYDPAIQTRARAGPLILEGWLLEQVEISARACGIMDAIQGDFAIHVRKDGKDLTSNGEFLKKGERLELSQWVLKGFGATLQGRMQIGLREPSLNGNIQAQGLDLADVSSALGYPMKGRIDLNARLQKEPESQTLFLDLKGQSISSGYGHAEKLVLQTTIRNLFTDPSIKMTLDVSDFKRKQLELHSFSCEAEGTISAADFKINADGVLSERPLTLESTGMFEMSDEYILLRLESLMGRFERNRFRISEPVLFRKTGTDYDLEWKDWIFEGGTTSAAVHYSQREVRTDVRIRSFPASLLTMFGFPDISGTMTGKLEIRGQSEKPEVTFNLQGQDLQVKDLASIGLPSAQINMKGGYSAEKIQASLETAGLPDLKIEADLTMPVRITLDPSNFQFIPRGPLDGKMIANADLESLATFFVWEDQSLKGLVAMDLTVGGQWDAPRIDGIIRVKDGSYEHLRHGLVINNLQITADMRGRTIVIKNASAADGQDGRITAEGWLSLDRTRQFPLNLVLGLKKCTLIRRQDLTVTLDGDMNLSGNLHDMVMAGNLTVGPAEYRLPERPEVDIPELDVREIHVPRPGKTMKKDEASGKTSELELDMKINSPGQVFIRGRNLSSEWEGDIQVKESVTAPVIIGRLNIIRGRYTFYGKHFDLIEGTIQFSGLTPPSPSFWITAVNERSDLTVRILISGTPDLLNIALESDPVYPEEEILSRLLFGRSLAEITPFQALMLANAVGSLAGAGGGGVNDFIENTRELLGVDELSVTPYETGQTRVRVGKYLNEDVFVQLEKGFGADNEGSRVSVEVRISPHLSLESEAGPEGGDAILNWRWDY